MGLYGFLQMLLLFIAGFYVSYDFLEAKISSLVKIKEIVAKTRLYIGFVAVALGVLSFFRPFFTKISGGIELANSPFIGDLIPALLLLASGLIMASVVFNYINLSDEAAKSEERKNKVQQSLEKYGTVIGIATIIAGVLHFIDLIGGGYPFI